MILHKKLIEKTNNSHSSPAIMVRNYSGNKRKKKTRIVINYKRLSEQLEFDEYFIPQKDVLVSQTKEDRKSVV